MQNTKYTLNIKVNNKYTLKYTIKLLKNECQLKKTITEVNTPVFVQ